VGPAKTAETIKFPFAFKTRVGPMNQVLHDVQMPTWEGTILRGKQANQYRDTLRSCADIAEPIEVPFGLHGTSRPPWEMAILVDRRPNCKVQALSAVSCVKTAEPIHLPFWLWTRVGRRMHKFNRIRQVAPMCPHRRTR